MCDKIKVFKLYLKYLHLYLITVLTKVIAIVFVFENFRVFVIVFKYYAIYLDPSLTSSQYSFKRFVISNALYQWLGSCSVLLVMYNA